MKSPTLKLTATALAFAACLGLTLNLWAQDKPAAEPVVTTKQWQHLALAHDTAELGNDADLARQINKLGREGWEMVNVLNFSKDGSTNNTMYYFKKPL
jgi:hypothetical protein